MEDTNAIRPTENAQTPVEIPTGSAPVEEPCRATHNTPMGTAIPAAPKARKAPAPKPRPMSELHELDPKKMTDAEKNIAIAEYRDVLNQYINQDNAVRDNAKSAYEQARSATEKYNTLVHKVNEDMAFIRQTMDNANKVIQMIGGVK